MKLVGTGKVSGAGTRLTWLLVLGVMAACSSPVAHADHAPRHGGVVMMYGDLHYEVVLSPQGRHLVYLSDAFRRDLPPTAVSNLVLAVDRGAGFKEVIDGVISTDGRYWTANGSRVSEVNAVARVAFTAAGKRYWIDIPFGLGSPAAP
jgi:hypothetical protein